VTEPEPPAGDPSRAWVVALGATGRVHDDAVARLHAQLLRAARFEVRRRRATLGGQVSQQELEDLATQATGDAVVAILGKLDTFRGESRFTTWAYKFVLLEAAVKCRRRAWQQREVTLGDDGVPIDVLAQRLRTTRGALYKTLHDARRKLRAEIERAGLGRTGRETS
jgi:RNA polymerase sigma-70 factor (ECF subfamily)